MSNILCDASNAGKAQNERRLKDRSSQDSSQNLAVQGSSKQVLVHPPRHQYALQTGCSTKTVVPWSDIEVKIREHTLRCFVCGTHEDGRPLRSCSGAQNGIKGHTIHQCSSMFHLRCLKTHKMSGCKAGQIEQEKNQLLCSLHCCNACYRNGQMDSSFDGTMIECAACYRSFHVDCEPCGSLRVTWMMDDDDNKIPVNIFICPSHAELSKPRKHLPVCYKCGQKKGPLQKCEKCIRSFHTECSTIATVDEEPKTVCEFCLNQHTLSIGSKVIALYKNEWIVGYPEVWSAVTNLSIKKYTVGKVIVRWEDDSTWKVIPANRVIQFFDGAEELLAENSTSEMKMPASYKDVEKRISTSKYSDPKLLQLLETEAAFDCDCEDMPNTDGIRCRDDCQNRESQLECPPKCAKRPGGCANRSISEKYVCENIAKRLTEKKGFGVFALADIEKGEFIAEYAGEIITKDDANERIQLTQDSNDLQAESYMMQLRPNRIVDASTKGNIARYINHSCSPNCQPRVVRIVVKSVGKLVKYDERIGIKATEKISKGKELTFKYEQWTVGDEPPECLCESNDCTGVIGKVAEKEDKPAALKSKSTKKRGRKIEQEPEEDMETDATTSTRGTAKYGRKSRKDSMSPSPDSTNLPSTSEPNKKARKLKRETAAKKSEKRNVLRGGHAYSPCHVTRAMPDLDYPDAVVENVDTSSLARHGDPEPEGGYSTHRPRQYNRRF